jgi:hypothetical protein
MAAPQFTSIEVTLQKGGQLITDKMKDTLIAGRHIQSGDLARSLTSEVQQTPNGYQLSISGLEYGQWIDQGIGRGPGKMPPKLPIQKWIKQKSIPVPQQLGLDSFVFLIQKKIAREGTKPKPVNFIQPSVDFVVKNFLDENLERLGAEDIDNMLVKYTKQ